MTATEFTTTIDRIESSQSGVYKYSLQTKCLVLTETETEADQSDFGDGHPLSDTQLRNRIGYLANVVYGTHGNLAESLGVARPTVSNWLRAEYMPGAKNRKKINRRFRYHFDGSGTVTATEEKLVQDEWPVSTKAHGGGETMGSHPVEPKSAWTWDNSHFGEFSQMVTDLMGDLMELQNDTPNLQLQALWILTYRGVDDDGVEVVPNDMHYSPGHLENHANASDDVADYVEGRFGSQPITYYSTMSSAEFRKDWKMWFAYLTECKQSPKGSTFRPIPRYYSFTLYSSIELTSEQMSQIEEMGTTTQN